METVVVVELFAELVEVYLQVGVFEAVDEGFGWGVGEGGGYCCGGGGGDVLDLLDGKGASEEGDFGGFGCDASCLISNIFFLRNDALVEF